MTTLPHSLERSVLIRATPSVVFRFFTDSVRWSAWWGAGSTIDARPGGAIRIVLPGNVEAGGNVVELKAPERLVFTHGFASGKPMPIGGSRVTITLAPTAAGTQLTIVHDFAEAAARDEHVQGWRYQLSLFGNVVADEVNANALAAVDAWFASWSEIDVTVRAATLARIATASVTFRDRYSNLDGVGDILSHITAALHFMPNVRLVRDGAVRHCQGVALADWTVAGRDGKVAMSGTNVFTLGPTGLIESVVGVAATKVLSGSVG